MTAQFQFDESAGFVEILLPSGQSKTVDTLDEVLAFGEALDGKNLTPAMSWHVVSEVIQQRHGVRISAAQAEHYYQIVMREHEKVKKNGLTESTSS
jgi:hypothetical protein